MDYFNRRIDDELQRWKEDGDRMPLLIRGARQVGKTSSIRHLGESFQYYVEIDLNESSTLREIFADDISPQEICRRISYVVNKPIIAGKTLLFIDEIQSCPAAINKLRYFYEQYQELHLIAAGSLLEFVLADLPSFGVGRVRSLFMYPFSFEEFLRANGEELLIEAYRSSNPDAPLPEVVHNRIINLLKTFLLIGGMPKVVSSFVKTNDLMKCQRVLTDLVVSYRDDFKKYRKRISEQRIGMVLDAVAQQKSGRFVYSNINDNLSLAQVKLTLDLLVKAGLVYSVLHTSANGIPLGAEVNERYQRMSVFDTGVQQCLLGADIAKMSLVADWDVVNKGTLAEVYVAAELVKAASYYERQQLYCWHREKKDSQAEVDFVVQVGQKIVPVEVKSGAIGKMKSLRIFMDEKHSTYGVRTSMENFAHYENIRVYPLYAISNLLNAEL